MTLRNQVASPIIKPSNKSTLSWRGLGLWCLCLDPNWKVSRICWHTILCKVIQSCSLEKNLKKQCCKIWDGFWNWHCIWSLLHSKKVRCVSHDTSHILNNPIVTSEKISKSPHAFKRHCKIRLPFWDGSGLLWLLLRSELEGHPGMLTHHPFQSFPVMFCGTKTVLQDVI